MLRDEIRYFSALARGRPGIPNVEEMVCWASLKKRE